MFGRHGYWLRVEPAPGEHLSHVGLRAVRPNTVWAVQARTIRDEILGSSEGGAAGQRLKLRQRPVLLDERGRGSAGELIVAVGGEHLSEEERRALAADLVERDDLEGTWVRWHAVDALSGAGPSARRFEFDWTSGELRFGDGDDGAIPAPGVDNIRALRYVTGGGARGNVAAGAIATLVSAVSGVESVTNSLPAGGGSDPGSLDDMLVEAPVRLHHRDRAVSRADYASLALQASRSVARVEVLPASHRPGGAPPGTVHVLIVPDEQGPAPAPSLALRRVVHRFLEQRAPVAVATDRRIVVDGPTYVPLTVSARVAATTSSIAASLEHTVRAALDDYLSPLAHGRGGRGWPLGAAPYRSELRSVIERLPGVDHVASLEMRTSEGPLPDGAQLGPQVLVASGAHDIAVAPATAGGGLARATPAAAGPPVGATAHPDGWRQVTR
jgi:predicted phage baseplate assembly protein